MVVLASTFSGRSKTWTPSVNGKQCFLRECNVGIMLVLYIPGDGVG